MADARYGSMAAMMGAARQPSSAPIPTTTFAAQNIIGTPIPQVGDSAGRAPNYAGTVGQQPNSKHVVIVVVAVIVGGYLAYHYTFEK